MDCLIQIVYRPLSYSLNVADCALYNWNTQNTTTWDWNGQQLFSKQVWFYATFSNTYAISWQGTPERPSHIIPMGIEPGPSAWQVNAFTSRLPQLLNPLTPLEHDVIEHVISFEDMSNLTMFDYTFCYKSDRLEAIIDPSESHICIAQEDFACKYLQYNLASCIEWQLKLLYYY